MAFKRVQYKNCNSVKMFILLVVLSFYQNAIANHPPHKGEIGPFLASLKAVKRAVASEFELSKAGKKPVFLHSDSNLSLEDVIKEKKLRKMLELIKENNKAISQNVDDKSTGPRIFVIKENVSDDYDKGSEDSESKSKVTERNIQSNAALKRHPSRRNPDLENSSDEFKERRNAKQFVTHLGLFEESRETTPGGKDRSYVYEDDNNEYTTKRKVYQNTIDIFTGRDWDEPSPLRQTFPKYTDGPFDVDRSDEKPRKRITAMRPFEQKPPKGIPYSYSKEERWNGKMLREAEEIKEEVDESIGSQKQPYRSYGSNRHRGKNQLLGRTQIPYAGNRNVYEK